MCKIARYLIESAVSSGRRSLDLLDGTVLVFTGTLLFLPMGQRGYAAAPDMLCFAVAFTAAALLDGRGGLKRTVPIWPVICCSAASSIAVIAALAPPFFPKALHVLLECMQVMGVGWWVACVLGYEARWRRESKSPYAFSMSWKRKIGLFALSSLLALLLEASTFCGVRGGGPHAYLYLLRCADLMALFGCMHGLSIEGIRRAAFFFSALVGCAAWHLVSTVVSASIPQVAGESLSLVFAVYCVVFALLSRWFVVRSRVRRAKRFKATEPLVAALEQDAGYHCLSVREREVAVLLVTGFTLRETASLLEVSLSTAGTYRRRVFEKMDVRTKDEFIRRLSYDPDAFREPRADGVGGACVDEVASGLTAWGVRNEDAVVLARIAFGQTARQIAKELYISPSTVSQRRARGYRMLEIHNRRELLMRIESCSDDERS